MSGRKNTLHALRAVLLGALLAQALPAQGQIQISHLGTGGWFADDSINASGVALVGSQYTHYGKPGQTPTTADDTALAQRLNFTRDASSPNGSGSLTFVLDALPGKKSKSTLSLTNEGGFGPATFLTGGEFSASYVWAESAAQSWNNLAFRFGLQSSLFGTGVGQSQAGFTATHTGEAIWDVILVYVPPTGQAGVWNTTNLTADTTGWKVYFQSDNTFWNTTYHLTSAGGELGTAHSLNYWLNYDYDSSTAGVQSFLAGADITSIQFGLGSSTGHQGEAYLASFDSSVLDQGYTFAAIPEPGTAGLLAGALGLAFALSLRLRSLQR